MALKKDPIFDEALNEAEQFPWQSLKSAVTNFLGNHKSAEYKEIEELLKCFCQFGTQRLVKLHFLQSKFDYFPKSCGDLSEKKGECFHQDICIMEQHYQGQWYVNFLTDYCGDC